MTWMYINVGTCLITCIITAYQLGAYPEKLNVFERSGCGLIGASMLLRIGPIVVKAYGGHSPFDDWSIALCNVGIMIYVLGRLYRHSWQNFKARRDARVYLRGRGKL